MSTELTESMEAHAGGHHQVHVSTQIQGHGIETFSVSCHATLLELMAEGAVRLTGLSVLPPTEHPFDRLYSMNGEEPGQVIENLHQTIDEYLRHPDMTPHFAIELLRTFRVNTRWDVAPKPELSPKEILCCRGSIWSTRSTRCTTPRRTNRFRSTRPFLSSGVKSSTRIAMVAMAGSGTMGPNRVCEEVDELVRRGVAVKPVELNGQCYVLVEGVEAPSPPWSIARFDIVIAIPAAYDAAELDGFYVALPCGFNNGEHPRIKGNVIELLERKWRQVSWHYPEGKPWRRGQDSLETHIFHCRGFFLQRRSVNAP